MTHRPVKIGIIGAMDLEVETLMSHVQGAGKSTFANMRFCEGMLDGTPVVVAKCGVGKVAAALCVQVLVDRFGVTHVVNTGVAGSLDARIDIADLVVSTDALYHDVDVTVFGYEPGQVPGLDLVSFPADPALREALATAAGQAAGDVRVFHGRVVSGDQFIDGISKKEELRTRFGGLCCEMEGAAIAHTCHVNAIPFVIVRAISDKADGTAQTVYSDFETASARRCAAVVEQFLRNGLQ